MGWLIGSILFGLTVLVSIKPVIESPKNNLFPAILLLVLAIVFFKKYRDSKNGVTARKKEQKVKEEKEIKEKLKTIPGSKERIKELGSSLCVSAKHMSGLPVAESAYCYIYLCEDKIIFERNEIKYNLLFNKLRDITMKTDAEIHKAYISSIGGAVAGNILFGPLGAMVGGRVKVKQTKTLSQYLIFTYENNDKVDFISFDVTSADNSQKFVDYFKNIHKENKIINL